MEEERNERHTTALHEAAHAVAASAQCLHPYKVSIIPGAGYDGMMRHNGYPANGTAFTCLAGYAFEHIHELSDEWEFNLDVIQGGEEFAIGPEGERWDVPQDFKDALRSGEHLETVVEELFPFLQARCVEKKIRRLAGELVRREEITSEDSDFDRLIFSRRASKMFRLRNWKRQAL